MGSLTFSAEKTQTITDSLRILETPPLPRLRPTVASLPNCSLLAIALKGGECHPACSPAACRKVIPGSTAILLPKKSASSWHSHSNCLASTKKKRTFAPTVPATPPDNAYHGGTSSFMISMIKRATGNRASHVDGSVSHCDNSSDNDIEQAF